MNNQDKHISTIKKLHGENATIYKPKICGIAHSVYVAENNEHKTVYRFSNEITAHHNLFVSQQLQSIGLCVPNVSVCNCDGQCIETYPFIEGKTFHERLVEGLSIEKQDAVYKQLFDISYKISKIPYDYQFELPHPIILKTISLLFRTLGIKQKEIYHTDLHARNIILDKQDNVRAILDLDAVYPEYFSVVLLHLIQDAKGYNYPIDNMKYFSKLIDNKNCIFNLETQMKIYSIIRNTFRFFANDFIYKQLLKIRVK